MLEEKKSIFQGETLAIPETIQWYIDNNFNEVLIFIYSNLTVQSLQ